MKESNKKKLYNILSIILLSIMFIVMCLYASKQCFWVDELDWTIEFFETGYNLPLSYLMMYPIYKIAPYGEIWLLIPNIIIVLIGCYFVYKIGKKIGEEDLGFFSLIISITSFSL